MTTTQTERTREFVRDWLAGVPVIAPKVREPFEWTDDQMHARAIQEARMRNEHRRQMFAARQAVAS